MDRLFTPVSRGVLSEIHISDIHFGAIDPRVQYDILKEQVIDELFRIPIIDIIFINGDLFERKYATDSDEVLYATNFIEGIRLVAIEKNATVVIISGTESHDAGQLNLLYHYMKDPAFDIRIVETIKFEYVKGARILCIPELYGIEEDVYDKFLFRSGLYDQCVIHGTIKGAIYGDTINSRGRLFTIEDFNNCRGPIIAGHVHVAGCYEGHFYYTGSPIRYKFGEEQEKGFMIVYYNLDTGDYYNRLIPVKSFRYDTVYIDDIINNDPKDIIAYIDNIKSQGIDYLRVAYKKEVRDEDLAIIKEYYRNNREIKIASPNNHRKEIEQQNQSVPTQYRYLLDGTLSPYEKLARYINDREQYAYFTGDDIKKLVEEDL